MKRRPFLSRAAAVLAAALLALALVPAGVDASSRHGPLAGFKHIVVIYEENHSFDNLYGNWGSVGGQHVVGRSDATGAHTTQVAQDGSTYDCLLMTDVNLMSPPLAPNCSTSTFTFPNGMPTTAYPLRQPAVQHRPLHPGDGHDLSRRGPPVQLPVRRPQRIWAARRLHPRPRPPVLPGAVPARRRAAGPLRHRQRLGRHDDGLLRHHAAADLRVPARADGAELRRPRPLLPGGVRRLVPQPPVPGRRGGAAVPDRHPLRARRQAASRTRNYPLYHDDRRHRRCRDPGLRPAHHGRRAWPAATTRSTPSSRSTSRRARSAPGCRRSTTRPPRSRSATRLSDAGVSWDWYSGGWDNAAGNVGGRGCTNGPGPTCGDPNSVPAAVDGAGNGGYPYCPDKSFQTHHQPLNYFARYAPGQPDRAHLQDEQDFLSRPSSTVGSRRSASSSRSATRTSTPATPASRTAATTSST